MIADFDDPLPVFAGRGRLSYQRLRATGPQ